MEPKVQDLREYRKNKKRKKRIIRFFIAFIILSLTLTIYVMRNTWMPYFEDIVDNVKFEVLQKDKDKNSDFPITLTSSSDYKVKKLDNKIAILTDTYYNVYTPDGGICFSKQHAMANAVMKTAGKRAIIYDQGAFTFRVESKFKEIYTKKLDEKIMYANISREGYTVVVTMSDRYSSFMTVYDENGNEIFYSSNSEKIIGVDFTSKSNGCIISTMTTKNAQVVTTLTKYRFDSEKPVWQSESVTTLGIDVKVISDDKIILVGDTFSCFFSSKGEILKTYNYQSSLEGYSISDGKLALNFNNVELRKEYVIIISEAEKDCIINFEQTVNSIYFDGNSLYMIMQNKLSKYSNNGNLLREIEFEGNYHQLTIIGNNAYILGYGILDKIYVGA